MSHLKRHGFISLLLGLVIGVSVWSLGLTQPAVTLQQQVADYAAQSRGAQAVAALLIFQGWQFARSQRHGDRFKCLEDSAEILFLLALSYQLGPWQWLPITLWWVLLVLFVGLIIRRLWQRRTLPPAKASSPGSRWRILRLLPTLLVLGWTIFCLR